MNRLGVLDEFCLNGSPRVLIVAAHPDDETIGAGAQLLRARDAHIVHVTDGSPRNLLDARRYGFSSAAEYAEARRSELKDALAVAALQFSRAICLGYADQEAAFHLGEIADRLQRLFMHLEPAFVLTHPYEGGHPDHDACACAVHAAARPLRIPVAEFSSYHAVGDAPLAFDFLPAAGRPERVLVLNEEERAVKRRMLACFRTQQQTLALFEAKVERFRMAPEYDFSQPPHAGRLHYERYEWGMTGVRFTILAAGMTR